MYRSHLANLLSLAESSCSWRVIDEAHPISSGDKKASEEQGEDILLGVNCPGQCIKKKLSKQGSFPETKTKLNLCHPCLDFIIPIWSFKNYHFSRRCQCYLIYINTLIWHINERGQRNREGHKKYIRKGPHGVSCRLVIYPSEPKSLPLCTYVHTKRRWAQTDSEKFLWALALHSLTWKVR